MLGTPVIHRLSGRHPSQKLFHSSTKFSAPWAIAGMVAAFAGGTALGMLGGKKAAMSGDQNEGGRTWGLRRHHHHGEGYAACRMKHEGGDLAAPGAIGEKQGERYEGE